ncbi:hypothetical protein AB0F11_24855 [Streptomyces sp. NPDC032472]|uniref:hypothetical protein n=1 Tax=Streptomyces sp. NPDC032472 TaxID=3155018 RepID=UPI003408AC4B
MRLGMGLTGGRPHRLHLVAQHPLRHLPGGLRPKCRTVHHLRHHRLVRIPHSPHQPFPACPAYCTTATVSGPATIIDYAPAANQSLLTDREFTRIIETRGREFEWLKAEAARKAAAEQGSGFWGLFGDILGIVSAVAGVLALIPVLTPIAGPIAVVTAVASLGSHTVDASIKGDWDAMTFVGLGAGALAALPGIRAVAKSLKAGRAAMKTIGTATGAVSKASVVSKTAGRTFLATTGGSAASDASAVFNYIGTKGAKVVGTSTSSGKIAGKVLQGSVNLSTQVPLVVELAAGTDMSDPKTAATGTALTANYGQSIGSWGAVGTAAKRTGTVSLALFAGVIGRR